MVRSAEIIRDIEAFERTGQNSLSDAALVLLAQQDFFQERRSFLITPDGQLIDIQAGSDEILPANDHDSWLVLNMSMLSPEMQQDIADGLALEKSRKDIADAETRIDLYERELEGFRNSDDPNIQERISTLETLIRSERGHVELDRGGNDYRDLLRQHIQNEKILEASKGDMLNAAMRGGWIRKQVIPRERRIFYQFYANDPQDFTNKVNMLREFVRSDRSEYPGSTILIEVEGYQPNGQRLFNGDTIENINTANDQQGVRDWLRSRLEPAAKKKHKFVK